MDYLSEQWDKEQPRIARNKLQSHFSERVEEHFQRNSEVCDLGGGQGADAEYFMRHGHTVTLLDISSVALGQAQKRAYEGGMGDKLKVIHTAISEEDLPIKDHSMDVVFSRLLLHFFGREQVIKTLKEIKRILKPNCKAYIAVKSPEDAREMDFLKSRATEIASGIYKEQDGKIQNRFTFEQWKELLVESNIVNFEIKLYIEDLSDRGDLTKSGSSVLVLTEIQFTV